jgi:hypothetical protein
MQRFGREIPCSPRLFPELLILKDFKSSKNGTAESKGVRDAFLGTADSKGFNRDEERSFGCGPLALRSFRLRSGQAGLASFTGCSALILRGLGRGSERQEDGAPKITRNVSTEVNIRQEIFRGGGEKAVENVA